VQASAPQLFGRVLFVDDEDILVETVPTLLTELGMAVDTARSGERALALLRERASDYDLVILDLTMPRVGGREVYRDLRGIRPNLPVLLSSGYHPVEDGSLPPGVDGFLPKPYSREDLRAAVLGVLGRRRAGAAGGG
jgi:CheY-like chemotaxis protein